MVICVYGRHVCVGLPASVCVCVCVCVAVCGCAVLGVHVLHSELITWLCK